MYGTQKTASLTAAALISLIVLTSGASAGVVAHYSFETSATDDSGGNGLTLKASGSFNLVSGQFGSAVKVDAGEYLWNASSLFNISSSNFAISFWYRADSSSFQPIVSKINTNADQGYAVHISGSNITGDLRDHTGGVVFAPRETDDLTAFHHVVYQRSGSQLEIYMDGVLADTATAASSIDTSNAFSIGARNISSTGNSGSGGESFSYDGLIDELWVFDNALSSIEIANLDMYNSLEAEVPEPGSLALFGTGVLLLGLGLRRRTG